MSHHLRVTGQICRTSLKLKPKAAYSYKAFFFLASRAEEGKLSFTGPESNDFRPCEPRGFCGKSPLPVQVRAAIEMMYTNEPSV